MAGNRFSIGLEYCLDVGRDRLAVSPRFEFGGKESAQVTMHLSRRTSLLGLAIALLAVLSLGTGAFAQSDDANSPCFQAMGDWQQLVQEIQNRVADFKSFQQTPVNKITERPTVANDSNKSIAQQVSEALKVKEELLDRRRKECRKMLDLEVEAFGRLKTCLEDSGKAGQRKLKSLLRQRRQLVERVTLVISEVQEVEGKETYHPYADAWRNDPYQQAGRTQAGYWQNYQQMYRRWWGGR